MHKALSRAQFGGREFSSPNIWGAYHLQFNVIAIYICMAPSTEPHVAYLRSKYLTSIGLLNDINLFGF